MTKHRETLLANPELLHTPEGDVLQELNKLGIENEPMPDEICPQCSSKLKWGGGMVGEPMAWCTREGCDYSWTDHEAAIRAVF